MGELRAKLGVGMDASAAGSWRAWLRCWWSVVVTGRGAGGWWQGQGGPQGDARAGLSTPPAVGVEGPEAGWAWLRCPWAVAGPGRASRRRAEPKARGADGSRAAGPSGARNTSGATQQYSQKSYEKYESFIGSS